MKYMRSIQHLCDKRGFCHNCKYSPKLYFVQLPNDPLMRFGPGLINTSTHAHQYNKLLIAYITF